MKHLLTKPNYWTASDMGWELDTYDGSPVRTDAIYYPVGIPYSSFASNAASPTAAEYRAACRLVISTFNEVNSTTVTDLNDAQLPSVEANPTIAEMLSGQTI